MVLQASGAISLYDLQTEFGGTNPIGMDEYYEGGANVPSGTGVPTTGAIALNGFYGKAKQTYTNIITYNNYYSSLTKVNGAYTITQSGSDPNVQLQMNSASVGGSITHLYGNQRLQDATSVSIEFEIYIGSTAGADALFFYMGYNAVPSSSYYEGVSSTAYQLNMEIYQYAAYTRGFHLIKNGSTSAVASYSTTAHISSTWLPVKIIYTKSATNTFQIYFNGTNIINYSDASYASYVSGSGSYYGIGSRTGGVTGDMYIRRVQIGVSGVLKRSVNLNFYPPSATAFSSGWTGDGGLLMARSILWACNKTSGAVRVYFVHATPTTSWVDDVASKVSTYISTNYPSVTLTFYKDSSGAPNIATLTTANYDVAMISSDANPGTTWYSYLHSFADSGGGLVLTTFANASQTIANFGYSNYTPIQTNAGNQILTDGTLNSGSIVTHFITTGLSSFYAGTGKYGGNNVSLNAGATNLASYGGGTSLVAIQTR